MSRVVRKLLFLARFAPEFLDQAPEYDTEWGNSPVYHHRLCQALVATGVDVICAREPSKLVEMREQVDFVYSIFNRASFRNSEILVSSLCAYLQLPHLGGHPNTRAIAEDKQLLKLIAKHLQIPTPNWVRIDRWDSLDVLGKLDLPCIVKWRFGADSAGITPQSVAHSSEALSDLAQQAQEMKTPIIVEEFIPGENITVAAIGAPICEVFRPVRIVTDSVGDVQTYRQKKFGEGRREKSLIGDLELAERIRAIVERLYEELRPLDYFRVDFRHSASDGVLYLLEVNAVCNLHPQSSFAYSASEQYPCYDSLVRRILTVSLDRQGLSLK